jgi:PAS domain S-box-containing protein
MARPSHDDAIRVLHVDDDDAMLDLVSRYLERVDEGLAVTGETGAEAALERLATEPFDCILSDFDMPGQDGLAFLAAVRERRPDIPFLLYTGKGSEEIAAEAISRGVDDYLRKGSGEGHYTLLANRIRRETERSRRELDRKQRLAAMDAAREGICIIDADGRFTYANEAYCDLYGYGREALLGTAWQAVHPEDEVERTRAEILPAVDAEGEWTGLGTGLRADGTEFPESKSVASLPGGGLVVVVFELREDSSDPVAGPIERAVDALDRALEDEQLTDETAALARRTRDRFADEG